MHTGTLRTRLQLLTGLLLTTIAILCWSWLPAFAIEPVVIHPIVKSTAQVKIIGEGKQIRTASGFFYLSSDNKRYFVTNKHVVTSHGPTSIKIRLHTGIYDLSKNQWLEIPLYSKEKKIIMERASAGGCGHSYDSAE